MGSISTGSTDIRDLKEGLSSEVVHLLIFVVLERSVLLLFEQA